MAAQNFKLFLGCLGNGVTVCNSAVMEDGDFKMVAHIKRITLAISCSRAAIGFTSQKILEILVQPALQLLFEQLRVELF